MPGMTAQHEEHASSVGGDGRNGGATGSPGWLDAVTLDSIPTLHAEVRAADVATRLDEAARRGRLPGLKHGEDATSFRVRLYGGQFDRMLEARAVDRPGGSAIAVKVKLLPGMPTLFAVICLFTIWPGVWLMDSMLATYIPSSQGWWPTWTWYLPITVLPLPFAIRKVWRSSRDLATEDLRKTLASVARETGAKPAP